MGPAHVIIVERVVQHASWTDVLTAVGTVGATTLALWGIYRGWWQRPRLRMRMNLADPPNGDLDEAIMQPPDPQLAGLGLEA